MTLVFSLYWWYEQTQPIQDVLFCKRSGIETGAFDGEQIFVFAFCWNFLSLIHSHCDDRGHKTDLCTKNGRQRCNDRSYLKIAPLRANFQIFLSLFLKSLISDPFKPHHTKFSFLIYEEIFELKDFLHIYSCYACLLIFPLHTCMSGAYRLPRPTRRLNICRKLSVFNTISCTSPALANGNKESNYIFSMVYF